MQTKAVGRKWRLVLDSDYLEKSSDTGLVKGLGHTHFIFKIQRVWESEWQKET